MSEHDHDDDHDHDHEPTCAGDSDVDADVAAGDAERDAGLPPETRAALRAAWRAIPTPSPSRELADEDEATRRAVGWMSAAWRNPAVLASAVLASAVNARRAPAPLLAFARDEMPRRSMRGSARPAAAGAGLSGWRRQVAAAAVLLLLLGAALTLSSLLTATRSPGGTASPPVAAQSPPGGEAPDPEAPRGGVIDLDARPATLTVAAASAPQPIELRSGNVRLILLTDATRQIPETMP